MYNKIFEEKKEKEFLKGYRFNQDYDNLQLIDDVNSSDFSINNVYISEIGDIGSKMFEGNYSLDNFYLIYGRINKKDIETIRLDLQNEVMLYLSDNKYVSLSSSEDIELDDIFKKKHKKSL